MHTLMVRHGPPEDPAHFGRYYEDTHLPLAHALPGARRLRYSLNLAGPDGPCAYAARFEADFDTAEAMGAAFGPEAGERARADAANVATGGPEILHCPS